MGLASLMLCSFLEYEIAYLFHPQKMQNRLWPSKMSSKAQDGDEEFSPGDLLLEIPPETMYFHEYTHMNAELSFSSFIF